METGVTVARIDEAINEHLLSLSDLRSQRNSLSFIFRLPTDILANIFTHVAQEYHEGNDRRPSFRVPRWVNVSYVCRHWREVALNCPTLWSFHFIVSLRWTEELLARSKQASLKIRIKHDCNKARSWWSDLVERVLNNAERFQEFRMHMPAWLFPTRLSLYAPRLQIRSLPVRCHGKVHST